MTLSPRLLDIASRPVNMREIERFETENGKLGSLAMLAFLVDASRWLGAPYATLEAVALADPRRTELTFGRQAILAQGCYTLWGAEQRPGRTPYLGRIGLKNTSSARTVLMFETSDGHGASQGFQYVRLGPGDIFECRHNLDPVTLLLIVLGTVAVVAAAVGEAGIHEMQGRSACSLWPHVVCRDVCDGLCDGGNCHGNCHATETKGYWIFGSQAKACHC